MKKKFLFILQLIILFSINMNNVYASITLNYKTLNLGIDNSLQLNITGDELDNVSWNTSNPEVATVINGRVFGSSIGTAYISVTNGTYTDTCKVNVISNYVPVDSITLSETNAKIAINETRRINVNMKPNNASNKTINYRSSDTTIATVDSSGIITGKKIGTAYITVTAESKTASYKVNVVSGVKLNGITISPSKLELIEEGSSKLTVSYNPTNASNKEITWKSSNDNVVTVDSNGNLKAKMAGNATISATSKDGSYTASSTVTVTALDKALKGISLNKDELTLKPDDTEELSVIFNPTSAENKKVTWTSSNSNIVTVENGKITAIKPGKVTIKATSEAGNFEATCKVIVLSDPIESIKFAEESKTVYVGANIELETISTPENTIINDPIWRSSDETVAVVDEDGLLTALQVGTTTITISDQEGKITASMLINVSEPPEETLMITIDGYNLKFNPAIKNYTLKIKNENELKINVNRDSDDVIISGNRDLKKGSIITITVYDTEKLTYVINITKSNTSTIIFISLIIILISINIYLIFYKNNKTKPKKIKVSK